MSGNRIFWLQHFLSWQVFELYDISVLFLVLCSPFLQDKTSLEAECCRRGIFHTKKWSKRAKYGNDFHPAKPRSAFECKSEEGETAYEGWLSKVYLCFKSFCLALSSELFNFNRDNPQLKIYLFRSSSFHELVTTGFTDFWNSHRLCLVLKSVITRFPRIYFFSVF